MTPCRITLTLEHVEACPEGACPFWEQGGAVIPAQCGLERLSLELDRPDIARHFLELRQTLERTRDERERHEAQRAFAAVAPPELSGH